MAVNNQSSSGSTPATTGANAPAKPSFLTGVANFFRPNFGKDGPTPKRGSRMGRSIMGMFAFVIIAEIMLTVVSLLVNWGAPSLATPLFPGVSWLGQLNGEIIIVAILILILWFVFNRMGWFPKPEPLPTTARAGTPGANKKGVTQIPGIGGPKVRTVKAVAPAKSATAAAPAKPSFFSRLTSFGAKATAKAEPTAVAAESINGDYDEAYERVKAAQRLKRRRSLR